MMTRLRLILGLCAVLMAVPFVAFANDTTYYVDRNLPGSDSNNGLTVGAPLLRISYCVTSKAILPGDTCLVRTGTYTEDISMRKSGTAGHPITIKNYPGELPLVSFSNAAFSIDVIATGGETVAITYITIEGLEITGGHDGIKLHSCQSCLVRGNNIHDNANNGILGNGFNTTVDRNIIRRNGNYATCSGNGTPNGCNIFHGMYATGKNWVITNNLIYDNTASGIQLAGYAFASGSMPNSNFSTFSGLVAHNTIAYQRHGSGMFIWTAGGSIAGITLENNIFYENAQLTSGGTQGPGYTSCNSCTGIVRNNLWYGTGTSLSFSNSSGTNPPTGMVTSGTINADPLMVNAPSTVPATPDFSLTSTSPAIAAGFAGVGRACNGVCDIGPHETLTATGGSVTGNVASVQADMNAYTPLILPNTTGWTVNNGRTVTGVALSGSSVANLTFSGAACAGESWTASYSPGTASDSALIGGTKNQLVKAFGPIALTNNCEAPAAYILTQTAGAIYGALLPQTTSPLITTVGAGSFFAVRTKWKATAADPPPLTTTLQYSITGEAGTYADVPDAYTAGNIRYAGLGTIVGMDAHGTPVTTERLTSTFSGMVAGAVIRCAVGCAVPTVDLTQDSESEQVGIMQLDTDATVAAVYWFRRVQSDGTVMTYAGGSTPSFTVSAPPILAAPVGLHEVGAASNVLVTLVWAPNTEPNLLGYEVYQSSTIGVYGNPVATITSASAAARQSPMTQWTTVIPVAGTYYFTVKAIGNGIEISAASNEVTVIRSGFAARGPIVTPRVLRDIGP